MKKYEFSTKAIQEKDCRQMYGKLRASDQRTLNTSVASKCIPQTFQSPSRGNLEVLKKSPEKPGEWDLKPGDFKNMEISAGIYQCLNVSLG